MSVLDLDAIDAIDVHVHVNASVRVERDAATSETLARMGEYFGGGMPSVTVPTVAQFYRERRMVGVVFSVDTSSRTGEVQTPSNDEVAELARDAADALIPFASIDPHGGKAAAETARRLIEDQGVRGFKFHPNTQGFFPNDRLAYPLYDVIAGHGSIALFHSGQTGVGARTRGGGGVRLKYSNPMHVDDVAVDFPDMKIILAHPSFPWQDEALSVANHKPNVYIDLSGWSPKYFPPQLVQYANTLLRDKVLFGSDYPAIMPDRWLADFEKVAIRDEVRPLILKQNAARLFGLTTQ